MRILSHPTADAGCLTVEHEPKAPVTELLPRRGVESAGASDREFGMSKTLGTTVAAVLVLAIVTTTASAQARPGRRPGGPTRRPPRAPDKLKVGDQAPDFTLKTVDGKRSITLSDYRGQQPVTLIFGSYT